jgi:ElaB/YqjD/DUF883 family membrane-anchored ribosome-binding protein
MATETINNTSTENLNETASDLKGKVASATSQAREKVGEVGRSAADAIDRNLETAAGKLQSTADSLRSHAADQSGQIGRAAGVAAEKLDATARYFREHNTSDLVSGVEQLVRRNPGASLAAALAVGFLIGSAIRRDDRL